MPVETLKKIYKDYLEEFFHDSKSIGIVLFSASILSLLVANTLLGESYIAFFRNENHWFSSLHLPHSLLHWINDGFMAVFFFSVGLEIKRELTMGELSTVKQALLPIGAALGGMVVPAFIYILFNKGSSFQNGWGIPMATDIAFSLGIAAMLGKKFPPALKIFLTALAIIDDLGAILVIAFFYGGSIGGWWLIGAAGCLGLLWLLNSKKRSFGVIHVLTGILLWYFVYNSGIHATVAGVLFAFMIPRNEIGSLEHFLHKPVNFVLLPLFALANTAIILNISVVGDMTGTLGLGIFLGLFVGKPLGVLLASWLMVHKKVATLPKETNWAQMTAAGILAGIGFTMSIFIASLAFDDANMQDISKLVVLFTAVISIIFVFAWLNLAVRKQHSPQLAEEK